MRYSSVIKKSLQGHGGLTSTTVSKSSQRNRLIFQSFSTQQSSQSRSCADILQSNNVKNSGSSSKNWRYYYENIFDSFDQMYRSNSMNLPIFIALASIASSIAATRVENCGIVGVVADDTDANGFLIEGLTILRNRGYDSAGVATVSKDGTELLVTKYASRDSTADSIDLLRSNLGKHTGHFTGIAHTRWATHGGKTDANAHPHTDWKHRIAVVHNGTINNAYEIKKELLAQGIKFTSETDTEVIAQLIGIYLDKGMDTKDAVKHALQRCDGSWGLAVVNKLKPTEVILACNGSPMMIGLGPGKTYIASETSAFSRYTKNFIAMKDGEIAVVTPDNSSLDISRVEVAPAHDILLTPDPFPHFTIKECLEQPEAIARALSYGARMNGDKVILGGLEKNKEKMKKIRNLLITGCGTSLFAGELGAKIMRDLECFDTVSVTDAAEVRRGETPNRNGGVLAISQSGETKDVHRAVKVAEEKGLPCISVVNVVGSLISRTTGKNYRLVN